MSAFSSAMTWKTDESSRWEDGAKLRLTETGKRWSGIRGEVADMQSRAPVNFPWHQRCSTAVAVVALASFVGRRPASTLRISVVRHAESAETRRTDTDARIPRNCAAGCAVVMKASRRPRRMSPCSSPELIGERVSSRRRCGDRQHRLQRGHDRRGAHPMTPAAIVQLSAQLGDEVKKGQGLPSLPSRARTRCRWTDVDLCGQGILILTSEIGARQNLYETWS